MTIAWLLGWIQSHTRDTPAERRCQGRGIDFPPPLGSSPPPEEVNREAPFELQTSFLFPDKLTLRDPANISSTLPIMASRLMRPGLRFDPSRAPSTSRFGSRYLKTSTKLQQEAAQPVVPVRRPVGAFRGGLFGFLLGSTLAGASVYYYILEEYKISNQMLTEDIYALQAATQRIYSHVSEIENKMALLERKK